MDAPIRQTPPLGPERLADESARAYRAFCYYRDFGPDRSLDRAWPRFCADHGTTHGSARRRPGQWALWSRRFRWVERAEDHDDLIEEAERTAVAERRRKLQEDRSRFEREEQPRMEKRVLTIDSVLDRLATAPQSEVTQVKHDKVTGKKTTTKIKALNGRDMAALTKVRNETARQTIEGYDIKDVEKEERKAEGVVWIRHKDLSPANQGHPESSRGNRQRFADLEANPTDSEDEAA